MSGYTNDTFWTSENVNVQGSYYDNNQEYANLQAQQLDFQTFNEATNDSFYPPQSQYVNEYPEMLVPDYSNVNSDPNDYDEPPLLEELEIYPDRIIEKTLAVLNPFRSHSLADDHEFLAKDTDLAGPLVFCLALAICLFLTGNRAPFGYIYGLSVVSCILMYCLLTLMTSTNEVFTLASVASILGYCLLPIVILSLAGIFVSLHGPFGIFWAILSVVWSSLSASRLFVAMSGDKEQRPLIAYPCALVCGVFALLVVF